MHFINERITVEGLSKNDVKDSVRRTLQDRMVEQHGTGKALGMMVPISTWKSTLIHPESVFSINGVSRTYRAIGVVL